LSGGPVKWENLSDEGLVEQVQTGNEDAFEEIVGRYQGRIINFVYRFIGNYDRAEEIAQEVFLRICVKADKFDNKYRFSTWIYTIAKNLARNALRDASRKGGYHIRDADWNSSALETLDQRRDPEKGPVEKASSEEIKLALEVALAKLEPNWRAALIMKEYDQMTYEDIGNALDVAVGTAKSWVHRAKETLARRLKDKGII